jgi:hypothetical protein
MARVQTNGIKLKGEKHGMTNEKQRQTAMEGIAALQQAYVKLVPILDESFKKISTDMSAANESIESLNRVLGALLEVLGEETQKKVVEVVKQRRIKELEDASTKQFEQIQVMVAEGRLTKTDTITTNDDIVVVSQRDEKGEIKYPTRTHAILKQFETTVAELLLNKKVGETLTLPAGDTVEVLDCYKVVSAPVEEKKIEETVIETPTARVGEPGVDCPDGSTPFTGPVGPEEV